MAKSYRPQNDSGELSVTTAAAYKPRPAVQSAAVSTPPSASCPPPFRIPAQLTDRVSHVSCDSLCRSAEALSACQAGPDWAEAGAGVGEAELALRSALTD